MSLNLTKARSFRCQFSIDVVVVVVVMETESCRKVVGAERNEPKMRFEKFISNVFLSLVSAFYLVGRNRFTVIKFAENLWIEIQSVRFSC